MQLRAAGLVRATPALRAARLTTRMAASSAKVNIAVKGDFSKSPPVLGDCPFCHRALLTLEEKSVPYEKTLVDFANKPDWLLEVNPAGSVPVMKDLDSGKWVVDSGVIVDWLEEHFPQPELGTAESAPQVGGKVFPAFVQFLKAPEADASDKEQALLAELRELDAWLVQHGGPYTGGKAVSATDCSLLPKLYHMEEALAHFKNWQLPAELTAVRHYIDSFKQRSSWKATEYSPEQVVAGWARHLGQ